MFDQQKYQSQYGKKHYLQYRDQYIARAKAWKKKNPRHNQNTRLKYSYGITLRQYEQMLKQQKYVCYICGKPNKKRRLNVDHNMVTRKVRKLLCNYCNTGLALIEKQPKLLLKFFRYLEEHENVT